MRPRRHPLRPNFATRTCLLLAVAASAASLGLTGCSADASAAEPETKTFSYEGERLMLETHEVATKVIAADREDIKVTRWFDYAAGIKTLTWELNGDTLELDAGCIGIAICDARFEVEVPRDLEVESDGQTLDLGRDPAASPHRNTELKGTEMRDIPEQHPATRVAEESRIFETSTR